MKKHAVAGLLLFVCISPVAAQAQSGDRVRMGEDITIEEGESAGDVVCVGCNIRVRGSADEVVALGGNVEIDGSVSREVMALGGDIRLGPEAEVGRDVVSIGGRVDRDPRATVGGNTSTVMNIGISGLGGIFLFVVLLCLAFNLVLVLLAFLIAGEQRVQVLAATTRENTGWAFLAGLGAIVGSLILLMLAATTGPFAPVLALLVCLLFTAALVVGYTGLSSWLGRSLFRESSALSAVLLGALVITLLQLIPLAGLLVFLAFSLLALGTVALSGFGTSPGWLHNRFVISRPAPPPAD